jgi:hypothetical protein
MIRVNLFEPFRPSIYGTATARDILFVCCAAASSSLAMAVVAYGIIRLLLAVN